MRQRLIKLNSWRLIPRPELAVFLTVIVMLLGSACTLPAAPEPENQPPVIHVVAAESEVLGLAECQVSCEATDADGDDLSYSWSAPDGGVLKGEGHSVIWSAPDVAGDYTMRVVVADGDGAEASDSLTITVRSGPNQLPAIISLVVTLPDQSSVTMGEAVKPTTIARWDTAEVQCNAEDPDGDELSFNWSTTGGKVHGEGDRIGWIAPGQAGNYTITVTVSDGRGGEAQGSVDFEVLCCGR